MISFLSLLTVLTAYSLLILVSTGPQRISCVASSKNAWYAEQILQQMQGKMEAKPVDLKMSIVKPLAAKWFVQLSDYLKSKPDIITNGFKGAAL